MAEEQKNVEVPKDIKVEETTPVVAPVVAEAPKEETPATTEAVAAAPVAETTEDKPAETTEETKAEEVKEEVKPIEEGHLNHKAQGLSFPKNLIGSKEFFFFGTDAFEPKTLSSYQKSEKNAETAHSNIAWSSQTGNGLLFIGDKKAPTGVINLSDASEPVVEGTQKFTLTSKGNKHSFKAANAAERDNWVAQLKLKIAEAKELATTVSESETYKKTLESFKPAPVVKEEKAVEAPKEETKVEEPVKADEAAKEEAPKEEKAESPKPLKSKRASFFGFMKKDETKEEKKEEEVKAEEPKTEEAKAVEAPVVAADKPVEEAAPKTEEAVVAPAVVPAATEPATEAVPAEEKPAEEDKPAESPKEKTSKRNSFFGGVFSKKEKKAAEPKPAEAVESPKEEVPPTTETAPVIPPVESTTPLAVDVSSPATVPTETTEAVAPTNGEPKKDVKEKRKSSLPFLGKREKSPSPSEGEEKSSKSAFSKLRATIKGKASPKAEEKPVEEATKEEAAKEEPVEAKATETPAEAVKEEPVKTAEPETETKPENVAATTTPAVTAAA